MKSRCLKRTCYGLARWIAEYYCAPLGEVLRGMLPLGGEVRRRKIFSLTEAGRDVARQLLVSDDCGCPLASAAASGAEASNGGSYLASKVEKGKQALQRLVKRGWISRGRRAKRARPAARGSGTAAGGICATRPWRP